MGQERSRVQRPLGTTPHSRTATRSGFVSFSDLCSSLVCFLLCLVYALLWLVYDLLWPLTIVFLGRPKSNAKQNANTTRIPYGYTNQKKWSTFLTNGRPIFHKCCLLLCDVKFDSGSCSFWEETHSLQPGEHAEVKALRHIITKEQQFDTVARYVTMYLSYSPCASCVDFIINFSTSRPQCQLSVRFSCLFRHEEDRHRDGLRRLNAAPRVAVGVFTNVEWKRVAEATGTSFYYHSPRRQSGDLKWKAEFENILKKQPGTTALHSSVPSKERDWPSVIIRPTHISQDQWSTTGAATNSALSHGRASRMLWQSQMNNGGMWQLPGV